ncbi:MAG: hypothetical protein GY859_36520 [Desulfobacterales bacterium]|nr:hypothetical protein [Desulfobacterales bacterium]
MNLLYYSQLSNKSGRKLRQIIESLAPVEDCFFCHGFEELEHRLRQPGGRPDLTVLFTGNETDLKEILSIHNLLRDHRIVLVLPDDEERLASRGHRLHPRYLGCADNDFKDVTVVLKKMVRVISGG